MKFINCCFSIIIFLIVRTISAQPSCDVYPTNEERVVQFSISSGRGAHFIEVNGQLISDTNTNVLTVEMWVELDRISNTNQFLGGLWGPGQDINDSWKLYINQNDDLVFEVNSPNSNLKEQDNTLAVVPFSEYFNKWTHICAVFDGIENRLSLYINSSLAISVSNIDYPIKYLRSPEKPDLKHMIGSINGLSDNTTVNRTFRGKMDEIRIWDRAIYRDEINCNMNKSLMWNTDNLILYYRCNESDDKYYLCDATGNNRTGTMFSGTKCVLSERSDYLTLISPKDTTVLIQTDAFMKAGTNNAISTFQWQTNTGTGFSNLQNVYQYSGVTTNTLRIENCTSANHNQPFRCIISTNGCLDTTAISVLAVRTNVSVEGDGQVFKFTISPNPTGEADQFLVRFAELPNHDISIEMLDILGSIHYSNTIQAGSESFTIPVQGLSSGMYMLRVRMNNEVYIEKVVVN